MAEKKNDSGFKVTDRRLFSTDGEKRQETVEEAGAAAPEQAAPPPMTGSAPEEMPAPPSAQEQQEQADAYRQSTRDLDDAIGKQMGVPRPEDLEMTFEKFVASLYMTALLQLGLAHEQGGTPRIDLLGARQTIDTIGLLMEKTKGNLTAQEQNFTQNALYELRMAYLEVTNALARPPKPGQGPTSTPQ